MNFLFIIKVKVLILNKCSHKCFPIMLIIESIMVNNLWATSPISFKHVSFWYPFLKPHLIMHHSNIGVLWRWITELGPLTLAPYTRCKYITLLSSVHSFMWVVRYEHGMSQICARRLKLSLNLSYTRLGHPMVIFSQPTWMNAHYIIMLCKESNAIDINLNSLSHLQVTSQFYGIKL